MKKIEIMIDMSINNIMDCIYHELSKYKASEYIVNLFFNRLEERCRNVRSDLLKKIRNINEER